MANKQKNPRLQIVLSLAEKQELDTYFAKAGVSEASVWGKALVLRVIRQTGFWSAEAIRDDSELVTATTIREFKAEFERLGRMVRDKQETIEQLQARDLEQEIGRLVAELAAAADENEILRMKAPEKPILTAGFAQTGGKDANGLVNYENYKNPDWPSEAVVAPEAIKPLASNQTCPKCGEPRAARLVGRWWQIDCATCDLEAFIVRGA